MTEILDREQKRMFFIITLPFIRDAFNNKYMNKDLLNEILYISIELEYYECSRIIKQEIDKFK